MADLTIADWVEEIDNLTTFALEAYVWKKVTLRNTLMKTEDIHRALTMCQGRVTWHAPAMWDEVHFFFKDPDDAVLFRLTVN